MKTERERDAILLSEAIGKRALANRDWGASLGLRNPARLLPEELAKMHNKNSEASRRHREAHTEVRSLTDIIEKRALETGQA